MTLKSDNTINKYYLTLQQLECFQDQLLHLRQELKQKLKKHSLHIHDESLNESDAIDWASLETSYSLKVEAQSREQDQIANVNQAIRKI